MTGPTPPVAPAPAPAPVPAQAPWASAGSLAASLAAGAAALALGGLAGRPDVALLGAGPVLAAAWALSTRPRGGLWVSARRLPVERAADGAASRLATALRARVTVVAPPSTDAVRLRVSRPGHGAVEVLVDVPGRREVDVVADSVRTGLQDLVRLEHQGVGRGGHLVGPVGDEPADRVLVLPTGRLMPALPMPARLRGLTGQHRSRRAGDGGDLRDIHPYGPEDSLRRVDWRATARRSPDLRQLYVRRTHALAEAVVTLVVDSRDDVGPDPSTWSGLRQTRPDDATSLDIARQAAATVAQGYVAAGDRVAVEDLGVRRHALRPGAGRGHLARVVHQLALLRPQGDPPRMLRPPRLPSGSLVYVFSTFLDPEVAHLTQMLRRGGHRVVVVDVLPRLRTTGLDARERIALRIVRVERDDRLAELVASGAELLRWADAASTTTRLQTMARRSHRRPGSGGG